MSGGRRPRNTSSNQEESYSQSQSTFTHGSEYDREIPASVGKHNSDQLLPPPPTSLNFVNDVPLNYSTEHQTYSSNYQNNPRSNNFNGGRGGNSEGNRYNNRTNENTQNSFQTGYNRPSYNNNYNQSSGQTKQYRPHAQNQNQSQQPRQFDRNRSHGHDLSSFQQQRGYPNQRTNQGYQHHQQNNAPVERVHNMNAFYQVSMLVDPWVSTRLITNEQSDQYDRNFAIAKQEYEDKFKNELQTIETAKPSELSAQVPVSKSSIGTGLEMSKNISSETTVSKSVNKPSGEDMLPKQSGDSKQKTNLDFYDMFN